MSERETAVQLSVVAAARNERENVAALVEEIRAALEPLDLAHEIVVVDDRSTDDTLVVLLELQTRYPNLAVISLASPPAGGGGGQSAAMRAGLHATRGTFVATLDADLQNDPADLPALLDRLHETGADLVQGDRSAARHDSVVRRASTVVGRVARRCLLGDPTRDTGCSLRVMRREVALALPLEFRGMHRFVPITTRHLGYRVVEMPVHHRARAAGQSHYGIRNRALAGLVDCFAVRWMRPRRGRLEVTRHPPLPLAIETSRPR